MHYYSFNIADYRKDTHHLEPMEHYIYRSLMDSYYLNEEPIAKETQSVLRRLRLSSDHFNMLENVLNDFFKLEEDGWHHKRIDVEITEYQSKCEKNKANGKKGGRPKKQQLSDENKPKKTQSVNSANPNESESNPNQEPLTINQEPLNKKETKKINLKTFLSDCEQQDIKPIADDSIVFENAKKIGIDYEMISVAWKSFKDSYLNDNPNKKYTNWVLAFNKCVKDNWYKLWWTDTEGHVMWTSTGQQARKIYGEAA